MGNASVSLQSTLTGKLGEVVLRHAVQKSGRATRTPFMTMPVLIWPSVCSISARRAKDNSSLSRLRRFFVAVEFRSTTEASTEDMIQLMANPRARLWAVELSPISLNAGYDQPIPNPDNRFVIFTGIDRARVQTRTTLVRGVPEPLSFSSSESTQQA